MSPVVAYLIMTGKVKMTPYLKAAIIKHMDATNKLIQSIENRYQKTYNP